MKHWVMCPTFKREIYNKDLLKKTYGTPNWTIFLKCVRFLWINIIFLSIYLLWILINDGVNMCMIYMFSVSTILLTLKFVQTIDNLICVWDLIHPQNEQASSTTLAPSTLGWFYILLTTASTKHSTNQKQWYEGENAHQTIAEVLPVKISCLQRVHRNTRFWLR